MSFRLLPAFLFVLLCGAALPLGAQEKKGKEEKVKIVSDPDLIKLHMAFLKDAEKLAIKYEKDKQWSKAKDCYEQMLKLAPQHPGVKAKYEQLLQMEAGAQSHVLVLGATESWKDTGIIVLEDRPVTIRASGTWSFRLAADVTAAGLKFPEDLREFDPGCLVGMIVPPDVKDFKKEVKPFLIGTEKQLLAPKTGRLYVQMYDNNVDDNEGELTIEIRGTFQADEFKPTKKKDK
jgi:hypothetical protein